MLASSSPPKTIEKHRLSTTRQGYEQQDYVDWYPNGVFSNRTTQLNSFPSSVIHEKIAYDRGSKIWFKNCKHVKEQVLHRGSDSHYTGQPWKDATSYWKHLVSPVVLGSIILQNGGINLTMFSDEDFDSIDVPFAPDELEDLLALGLRNMVPKIDHFTEDFTLLSFLYELKDLKDMFTLWSKNASILKNAAGLVLNWELGWKPFLADCDKLFKKVLHLMDNIRIWNKHAASGVIYTLHANVTPDLERLTGRVPSTTTQDQLLLNQYPGYWDPTQGVPCDQWHWTERMIKSEERFIVHLCLRPREIPTRFIEDYISIWYDGLSMGDGASIIWNALPFSFVADWFWGFGDFLEQFQVEAIDVGYDLVDFGYSWKHEEIEHYQPYGGSGAFERDFYPYGGTHARNRKTYIRRRCQAPVWRLDDIDWSPLWDVHLPNWKQAWIGVNLLVSVFGK